MKDIKLRSGTSRWWLLKVEVIVAWNDAIAELITKANDMDERRYYMKFLI